MRTKEVGTATDRGFDGADAWLMYRGHLPSYYITKEEAYNQSWTPKKSLSNFVPGKMLGGDVFKNAESKLPNASGRIWHEADIDYITGKRNGKRILYSNDGLIFATYDHYQTFYEIIK